MDSTVSTIATFMLERSNTLTVVDDIGEELDELAILSVMVASS